MKNNHSTELILIRHARSIECGCLIGSSDIDCEVPDDRAASATSDSIGSFDQLFCSPAMRCKNTAQKLFPDMEKTVDDRLWEQDFGDWELMALESVPDIGELSTDDLARHTPPNGESFMDVYNRVIPAIHEMMSTAEKSVFVVHAGVIRAILGKTLSKPQQGLLFKISNLSITSVSCFGEDRWSVNYVNRLALV